MSRTLRILPEAEAELLDATEWYAAREPGLGIAFIEAIDHALASIVEVPTACAVWRRGYPYRRYVLRRFPFVIVFQVFEASIEVTAIAHAKREPGYWLGRTRH